MIEAWNRPRQSARFVGIFRSIYWSGTQFALYPNSAFHYCTVVGFQDLVGERRMLYAVAVRPGDVTTAVPEPQTLALLALGATVAARRRRAR